MAVANSDHGRRIKYEGGSEVTLEVLGEGWKGYRRPNIPTTLKGRATCRDYHIRKFRDDSEQNMQEWLSNLDSSSIINHNLVESPHEPFCLPHDNIK